MAFNDLQVLNVAGLLETALGSTLVKSVRRAPLAAMPAEGSFPVLAVYRHQDDTVGRVTTRQVVHAQIAVEYCVGRVEQQNEEDAYGALPGVVSIIRRILQQRKHASWPTGAHAGETLDLLCGIEDLVVQPAVYKDALPAGAADGAYPAFSMSVLVKHQDIGFTAAATLTEIDLAHNSGTSHRVPAIVHTVPAGSLGVPIRDKQTVP